MKKRYSIKSIAILLIISICISVLPTGVIAVSELKATDDAVTVLENSNDTLSINDIFGPLEETVVPEIIGYDEAVAQNHIVRLYEDEGNDLSKVVFLNSDGTKTMYLFDFPVKYVDNNGIIQDISLEIANNSNLGNFETASNSIITRFPANFTDGIALTANNTEILLVPELNVNKEGMATKSITANSVINATAKRIDKNTIEYRYDDKTTVEYSLTYTGFKEDIVVSEYTGQTMYPFRLYTNGLILQEIDGSYYLTDAVGNIRATIGDIIIFTADERNNAFGSIIPETIIEGEEYLLTIVVDAEYLADPMTAYPIRIDPTIEVNYSEDGSTAIEDITISTNTAFSGSHTSLYVGRRSTEGIARALIRFPRLSLSGISSAAITNAYLRVRDLMCEEEEMNVYCHTFTGNVWDANSATWNDVSPNSYVSTPLDTVTMSWSIGDQLDPIHWYYFDISDAVRGWITGDYNKNKGVMLKLDNATENGSVIKNRTFGSYNRASYKPSLSVTYNDVGVGGGNSFSSATELGGLNIVWTMVSEEKRYYKFTPKTSGEYMFYSTDANEDEKGDPIVNLYDSDFNFIDDADDEAYNRNFRISAYLTAGEIYYLECGHYGVRTGLYLINITQAVNLSGNYYFKNMGTSQYMDIHGPNAQELVHQWTFSAGNQAKWTVAKQSDGYYTIRSLYGDKKYVGVSNIYDSVENIVLYSSISDDCKWKIFRDSDGNLILETKKGQGKVLYVSNSNVGRELGLVNLSSYVDNRSFWKEFQYKYDYTITHYYDQGFVARFPDEVDQINSYQNICSDTLLAVFGLATGRSVQSYTSCADSCVGSPVTLAKTLNTCSHSTAHKTRNAMCFDVGDNFGYGSTTTTRCIWTGHLLERKNSCSYDAPYNVIIMNLGNVTDENHQNHTSDFLIKQMRLIELIHEASHQIGAADHYCYDPYSTNCNNPNNSCWRCDLGLDAEPNCIMSSHYYDIESMLEDGSIADIYCATCMSSSHQSGIVRHLNDHHD